jgi:hypothetical protein
VRSTFATAPLRWTTITDIQAVLASVDRSTTSLGVDRLTRARVEK